MSLTVLRSSSCLDLKAWRASLFCAFRFLHLIPSKNWDRSQTSFEFFMNWCQLVSTLFDYLPTLHVDICFLTKITQTFKHLCRKLFCLLFLPVSPIPVGNKIKSFLKLVCKWLFYAWIQEAVHVDVSINHNVAMLLLSCHVSSKQKAFVLFSVQHFSWETEFS